MLCTGNAPCLFPLDCLTLSNKGAEHFAKHLNSRAFLPGELQSQQIKGYAVLNISHKYTQSEGTLYEENELHLLLFLSLSLVCIFLVSAPFLLGGQRPPAASKAFDSALQLVAIYWVFIT